MAKYPDFENGQILEGVGLRRKNPTLIEKVRTLTAVASEGWSLPSVSFRNVVGGEGLDL